MNSFANRLDKLRYQLQKAAVDAFLIDHPTNIYYLTGMLLSTGKMLISQDHAHLVVDSRYFERCKKESPIPTLLGTETLLQELLVSSDYQEVSSLGFDSETTSYKSYTLLEQSLSSIHKKKVALIPLENPVKLLRTIKDDQELVHLREAAVLGSLGFDFVCTQLKEGISEAEVAMELEIFWKRKGGKKVAFDPIIAFGKNSSMPHYRAGDARLKLGQAVLIDIGVTLNHYHSDMTRVVFFGEPDPKIREIYTLVQTAQQRALEACRPGITAGELDLVARDYIASQGYGEQFSHSLGHGVGLDIHELPSLSYKGPSKDVRLEPGMVVTIEPGIYLPEIGGVRIEDTVILTKNGIENITSRPKDIINILI